METTSRFINGVFDFSGSGLHAPTPIPGVGYTVPSDKRSQLIYFRGGNSSDQLIAVSLMKDGKPMRTFPIGARGAMHIPLAVVEDIMPDSRLDVLLAAPAGCSGVLVLDIGLIEI